MLPYASTHRNNKNSASVTKSTIRSKRVAFAFAGDSIFISAAMSQCPVLSGTFDPFSLDRWDPGNCPFFRDIAHFPGKDVTPIANTPLDWKETCDAHIFKADLPGLKKEEVKIEVEDGRVLQISGERKKEEAQKNDRWHRIERSHGKFLRRFRLPENAKIQEVKATMENGVLTVTVPKQPETKPAVRAIEISG